LGPLVGRLPDRTWRRTDNTALSDIAAVSGAVGGAAVTALFETKTGAFGAYCIGLAFGFFAYLLAARDPAAPVWMGGAANFREDDIDSPPTRTPLDGGAPGFRTEPATPATTGAGGAPGFRQ
jgi:hypothetical protein